VKLLLDTQVLLWAVGDTKRLSSQARALIENEVHELHFSAVSLWEVTIKNALGRDDFRVEPNILRRVLLDNAYTELAITSEHAVRVAALPPLHRDPFDRLLVAQAQCEGMCLVTADSMLREYGDMVRLV
jgi:PIN domain nuclease of toxin-antitoxin system